LTAYTPAVADEAGQVRKQELDPQAEARRRAALSQIRQYGDPVLRMRANEVDAFDDDLVRLVERMKRLMADANGVGLAGNQVGVLRRVLVLQPGAEEEVVALVNPRIVEQSGETCTDDEGCLSLQGVLVPVERSLRITVEGQDEQGADVRLELEDLGSRVAQHEVDHLDGVLILDRTTDESRRDALAVLRPRLALS
jgi:peptide deformylase